MTAAIFVMLSEAKHPATSTDCGGWFNENGD
jgi:hypothetical protein